MKAVLRGLTKIPGLVWRSAKDFRRGSGQPLLAWALVALLSAAAQIIFRRNLIGVEFATLNSALAAIGLAAAPVFALRQAFVSFHPPGGMAPARAEMLREAQLPLVQNFAIAWAFVCALAFLPGLAALHFSGAWIGSMALPNIFVLLGAGVCATIYERENKIGRWALLLCLAGLVRLIIAWTLTPGEPWAESGLAAGLCAGFVLLAPILRQARIVFAWPKMTAALRDREFRLHLVATVCVMPGLFLFTNADRIVAQASFGQAWGNNLGWVRWNLFDGYQAAGLLGRALLWGTQPLLVVLLAWRGARARTTRADGALLAIYVAALAGGAIALCLLTQPLARLFGGPDPDATAHFIPSFATAMIPLGLLQGVGFFCLASRRYPECFTLGLSALAYTVFLVLERNPQLLLTCMLGGGVVALLAVFFVAVVRWGRAQP